MIDMNMDIQHIMEACDKSAGAEKYNGKKCKKAKDQTIVDPVDNEGCKKESSIFDGAFQALDEFKSDINLYNTERIAAAKQSGQHAKDKDILDTDYNKRSKATRDYGTSQYNGTRNTNAKKPRNAEDKKYIDMRNRNREETAYNDIFDSTGRRIFNKEHPDKAKEYAHAQRMRKAKNESASIFDTLLDQV